MDPESSAAQGETDAPSQETSQAPSGRVYTQQEFDDAMAKMRAAVTKKAVKPYEDLGDIEELRRIKQEREELAQQEALKRGEFDRIMRELAERKDAEIARRDARIREYQVDTPLMAEAARLRAVNAEQVRSLLKPHVRLNEQGDVEVTDTTGAVRYTDSGQPMQVQDLVREFLDSNPHFVQPTPATTNTRTSISAPNNTLDITKLDMKNPEHRRVYAEYRKTAGLAR